MEIVKYVHYGTEQVSVRKDLKGKHKEHCLCFGGCAHFHPCEIDNCRRAQELYEYCVKWNMVTPVWECPDFKEKG